MMLAMRAKLCDRNAMKAACLFKVPFDRKPLGDGVARFYTDLAAIVNIPDPAPPSPPAEV
tara:strand:- start:929 stop:1108 length:180 start_codon:yes stop_codon:yes gene_type:complete